MKSPAETLSQRIMAALLPGCTQLKNQYKPKKIPSNPIGMKSCQSTDHPLISIVLPSFNQGHFLGCTLKSILDQQYPNLELIVVDGGSQDDSLDIIKANSEHINWWVSEPDKGQAHAINKGMARATGEILAWLNSDDCLMPGALHRVAAQFMKSGDVDVVYGHRVLIDEEGNDVGKWVMPGHRRFILTYADFIPQETMFWRADLWQKVGGKLDESFHFAMDWELIRRFVDANAKFKLIPAFLGQFRIHEMQKTSANIESDGFREMEIIRQRCRQRFSSHPALQNLYYLMQRAGFYSFAVRARLTESLWRSRLIKID